MYRSNVELCLGRLCLGIKVCNCIYLWQYRSLSFLFRCHLGRVIVYDTITKLGWSSNVQNHGIKTIIDQILSKDWDPDMPVPEAVVQEDCVVS